MSFLAGIRKLQCFYCGERNAKPKQNGPLRSFCCQHCEAVNYLDKNGQITDPPTSPGQHAASASRYAHDPRQRSPSPTSASASFSASESIFCNTCLKNQHILNQNKASVQPPAEGSAHYAQYLADLESLERRYPQVCEKCRPRARAAIVRANYTAKADNLRRTMEKTRSREVATYGREGELWRSLVLRAAGLGWYFSVLAQVLWHTLGAGTTGANSALQDEELFTDAPRTAMTLAICLQGNALKNVVDMSCFEQATDWLPHMLWLGLATLWWNNKLRQKYLGIGGRMIGTRDYYVTQVFTLLVRTAAWWVLSTPGKVLADETMFRRAHTVMAVALLFITIRSSTIVKTDHRPRVFYQRHDVANILPDTPIAQRIGQAVKADVGVGTTGPTNGSAIRPKLDINAFGTKANASSRPAVPQETSRWAAPYSQQNDLDGRFGAMTPTMTPRSKTLQSLGQNAQLDHSRVNPGSSPGPEAMDWSPSLPNSFSSNIDSTPSNDRYSLRSRAPPTTAGRRGGAGASSAADARQSAYERPIGKSGPFNGFASLGIEESRRRHRGRLNDADTVSTIADDDTEVADSMYDDGQEEFGGRKKNNKKVDFQMQPTRLWLEKDRVDTGLEDMFDSVFSIGGAKDDTDDDDDDDDTYEMNGITARTNASRSIASQNRANQRRAQFSGDSWFVVAVAILTSIGVVVGVASSVKKWRMAEADSFGEARSFRLWQ